MVSFVWIFFCSLVLALQSCGGGGQTDQRPRSMDRNQKEMRDQRNGDRYMDKEEDDDWDLPRCPEDRNQSKLDTPVTEKVNVSAAPKKDEESISAAKRSMKEEISTSLSAQK